VWRVYWRHEKAPPWSAWPSSTIMAGEAVYSLTSTKLIAIDRLGSGIQVTVIFKKKFPPSGSIRVGSAPNVVGRLGLGSRVMGILGSGVWVSASFEIFALTAGEGKLGMPGLWILELFAVYATDGQTDGRTDKSNAYCPLP